MRVQRLLRRLVLGSTEILTPRALFLYDHVHCFCERMSSGTGTDMCDHGAPTVVFCICVAQEIAAIFFLDFVHLINLKVCSCTQEVRGATSFLWSVTWVSPGVRLLVVLRGMCFCYVSLQCFEHSRAPIHLPEESKAGQLQSCLWQSTTYFSDVAI